MKTHRITAALAVLAGLALCSPARADAQAAPIAPIAPVAPVAPVAGTWGISADLARSLDRRSEARRPRVAKLTARLKRERAQRNAIGRRLQDAQSGAREARRALRELTSGEGDDDGCAGGGSGGLFETLTRGFLAVVTLGLSEIFGLFDEDGDGCATAADYELAAAKFGGQAHTLKGRKQDAQQRVDATRRTLEREHRLDARTQTKARAARLLTAGAVSCAEREGRLIIQLQLRNGYEASVQALVGAAPTVSAVMAVELAAGEGRDVELDGGAADRTAALACAPRLVDVRVAGYPVAA